MSIKEKVVRFRKASVPLVGIRTYDPASTVRSLYECRNGGSFIVWDAISGARCLEGSEEVNGCEGSPLEILSRASSFSSSTILVLIGMDSFLSDPLVSQGIWNLRDRFKKDGRTLFILGHSLVLPPSLEHDFIVIEDPLPSEEELREKVIALDSAVAPQRPGGKRLTDDQIDKVVGAIRGMSMFQAEQAVALSLRKEGVDLPFLWELRREAIEQVPGLSVDQGRLTFDHLGGLEAIKEFSRRRFSGPRPPKVVVRIEEIEKVMAGAAGDLSGVSQDALQVILNSMQDNEWEGLVAFGPPGSGKSLYSQVLANTFGCLSLSLDLGACKGSLVGESEQKIRRAMSVIKAIGGKDVFFVATCNRTDTLPAELQRRFTRGVWFFDLPSREERESIWRIQAERFGIKESELKEKPKDEGWSGANIRDCCDLSYSMGCSLEEASKYVVPAGIRFRRVIEEARREADGVYLSASYSGVYRVPTKGNDERVVSL